MPRPGRPPDAKHDVGEVCRDVREVCRDVGESRDVGKVRLDGAAGEVETGLDAIRAAPPESDGGYGGVADQDEREDKESDLHAIPPVSAAVSRWNDVSFPSLEHLLLPTWNANTQIELEKNT